MSAIQKTPTAGDCCTSFSLSCPSPSSDLASFLRSKKESELGHGLGHVKKRVVQHIPSAVLAHIFSFLPEEELVRQTRECKLFRDALREYMKKIAMQLNADTEDPVQQKMRLRYLTIILHNPNDKPYMLLRKMHEQQRQLTGPLHFFNIPRGSFGVQRFVEYERVITDELDQATRGLWDAFRHEVSFLPALDTQGIRAWLDDPLNTPRYEQVTELKMDDIALLSPQIGKFTKVHTLMINFSSNMNHEAFLPDTFSALKRLSFLSIKGRFLTYPMVLTQLPKLWFAHIQTEEMDHLPEEVWQHVYTGKLFTALIYAAFSIDALLAFMDRGAQNREKLGNPIFTSNFKTYPFGLWFQKNFLLLGNTPLSLSTSMPIAIGMGLLAFFFEGVLGVLAEIWGLLRHGTIPDLITPLVCALAILAGAASIISLTAGLALNLVPMFYNLFMMKAVFPIVTLVRDVLGYDRMIRSKPPR